MGSGSWTSQEFASYSCSVGRAVKADGTADIKGMSAAQVYKARYVNDLLNPKGVIRECRDSEEHPNTIPVILALDVTGSMGETAVEVAAELNKIMTRLYDEVKDVEFMIMGVGDFVYDDGPLQVSQFESDIRIAEQLDLLWFEFGGGGNYWESYTAPWAFAERQIDLDCWKRGKRGIIITMGDERLNPYLPEEAVNEWLGSDFQKGQLNTEALYNRVKDKWDIYHIDVAHRSYDAENIEETFKKVLDEDHFKRVPVNGVAQVIVDIVKNSGNDDAEPLKCDEISW